MYKKHLAYESYLRAKFTSIKRGREEGREREEKREEWKERREREAGPYEREMEAE